MHWNGNVAPMGVKFGMEEGTAPSCQISPHRCNITILVRLE